ncbi:MAG: argininosuccinate lyase, partial [Clostridiales bacterium]|nr:argininosuccinate lyase [Clostridiales bacterium]
MKDLNTLRAEVISSEGSVFPSPAFARCVLEPVYLCQRDYYLNTFFNLSQAHALMLVRQKLLTAQEGQKIAAGLEVLRKRDYGSRPYDPRYEDLFFMVENDLGELIGTDLAGRLHTARSRNDIGLAQYRIGVREHLLKTLQTLEALLDVLLAFADEHKADLMPAY